MNTVSSSDQHITELALRSRIVRLVTTPVRYGRAAWRDSTTHRHLSTLTHECGGLARYLRLRLIAAAVGIAMVVHMLLVVTAPRAVEPFALVVPAVVTVLAAALFAAARYVAHLLERHG